MDSLPTESFPVEEHQTEIDDRRRSIGYANLAKLDPQYGLYTSVVPPLIYALMGSSREIAIGPVAVVSLLLSSMIQKIEDPIANPIAYRKLVFTVTFFAGAFQAVFGLFRLGFLVDYLSHAAIVGFMGGAAIVIGLQQLKGLLGSFTRTAVNFSAGCQTAVSNIVMAITVLVSLELLTRLLYFTPLAILASIILSALPGLIDISEAYHIWKVDKLDFLVCTGAFFGVLFASVEIGLLTAVTISFAKIILHSIRPQIEVLGRIPETEIFCDVKQYPMAIKTPGIVIIRVNSGLLCFANANFIRERIMRWVIEEDGTEENSSGGIHVVVLDMSNVTNIDTSGILALEEVHKKLVERGIQLAVGNPRWKVIHKLKVAKFVDRIGKGWIFLSVSEAVDACFGSKMVVDPCTSV
ncbi:hypothetical protein RHGRI_016902 [Rhododendron griersonianum]|uniref:STAS domain-containing protein n=1 Tax=Rhododendron griersonianum TaxID=479676 RepID=A0AAV6JVU2_9ERIC|nr:hypothetical protein RHGRI_016902 [Rhododendron griersonianum]